MQTRLQLLILLFAVSASGLPASAASGSLPVLKVSDNRRFLVTADKPLSDPIPLKMKFLRSPRPKIGFWP